mgnify:CR=1 FL=1
MNELPFIYSHGNQFTRTDYYGPLPDGRSVAVTSHREHGLAPKVALADADLTKRLVELKGLVLS